MQHVLRADEIHIASIPQHVDSTRFGKQHIERMNIVQFAVGYMDEAWNVAAQVRLAWPSSCAALVERKCAQGNTDRHRSMVVESSA